MSASIGDVERERIQAEVDLAGPLNEEALNRARTYQRDQHPDWTEDCGSTTILAEHFQPLLNSIAARDAEIERLKDERQDALDLHQDAHASWRGLMDEHNELRTRVAIMEAERDEARARVGELEATLRNTVKRIQAKNVLGEAWLYDRAHLVYCINNALDPEPLV